MNICLEAALPVHCTSMVKPTTSSVAVKVPSVSTHPVDPVLVDITMVLAAMTMLATQPELRAGCRDQKDTS